MPVCSRNDMADRPDVGASVGASSPCASWLLALLQASRPSSRIGSSRGRIPKALYQHVEVLHGSSPADTCSSRKYHTNEELAIDDSKQDQVQPEKSSSPPSRNMLAAAIPKNTVAMGNPNIHLAIRRREARSESGIPLRAVKALVVSAKLL